MRNTFGSAVPESGLFSGNGQGLTALVSAFDAVSVHKERQFPSASILSRFSRGRPGFPVRGQDNSKPITRGLGTFQVFGHETGTDQGRHVSKLSVVLLAVHHLRQGDAL